MAYNLRTELSLRSAGRDYHNARGFGEKYFTGSGGWYFILPGGEVHRWAGSINGSPLVGEVDPSYHENLSSLLNAQEPTETPINATLTWSGHDLQIGIPNQYAGTFVVTVTATDGFEAVETDFSVNVVNQAPTVSAIADQQFATGQNTLAVDVLANDLDGDTLTYSADRIQHRSIAAVGIRAANAKRLRLSRQRLLQLSRVSRQVLLGQLWVALYPARWRRLPLDRYSSGQHAHRTA